ncbi:MAG TPA: prepilin peptidase [Patescibacteria group bacterium]|nr:prepilin peptidase [Patescibacteria group bacterium]
MFLLLVFKFILGLIIGSFIAALSWRFPRGISNLSGRSFCDNCKKQLSWYDNIPLLSYLILGGRCRNCKKSISPRYFIIESVTAIGFTLIGFQIIPLILFCILEIIFIIDLENQIIPDDFVFLGIIVAIFNFKLDCITSCAIFSNLLAGFLSASFLLLIHLVTRGRGMGLGDVKFAVLAGMIVGLPLSPIWMLIAFLTGAMCGIILILGGSAGLKSKIAFGPFLIFSIPVTLLWGQKIIDLMLLH